MGTRKLNGYPSMTIGKFRVDWKTDAGAKVNVREIDFPLLRYSDVLLMYAEALNELNNGATPEAVSALRQVRLRAFGGDASKVGDIPTAHDAFLKAIQEERKLELGFEGWRRTDLVRWNILYETLTQTKADLLKMAAGEGRFANIDRYAAYKPETPSGFKSPLVHMSYTAITRSDSAAYAKQGYTVQNMYQATKGFINSNHNISASEAWMTTSLFRGLEKNKVEILPLNTTSIIDINKGLQGQQHPLY